MPDVLAYRLVAYPACGFGLRGFHTGDEAYLALAMFFALAALVITLASWVIGR